MGKEQDGVSHQMRARRHPAAVHGSMPSMKLAPLSSCLSPRDSASVSTCTSFGPRPPAGSAQVIRRYMFNGGSPPDKKFLPQL